MRMEGGDLEMKTSIKRLLTVGAIIAVAFGPVIGRPWW